MAYAQCTLSDHGSARGEFWGAGTVGAFEVVTYPMMPRAMPKSWMGQEHELEYVNFATVVLYATSIQCHQ